MNLALTGEKNKTSTFPIVMPLCGENNNNNNNNNNINRMVDLVLIIFKERILLCVCFI
jgi:hypothetical protein